MDRLVSGLATWTFQDLRCQGEQLNRSYFSFFFRVEVSLTWPFLFSTPCRSLGDVVAHSAGVISEPEFTEHQLDPKTDKFLVIATDGLWEFINNQETVDTVEGQIGPAQAVDTLVTEAGTRWMQEEQVIDDTTVIVANLFGWKAS